jgi:hypothetical protein
MAASFAGAIREEIRRLSRQETKRTMAKLLANRGAIRKTLADLRRRVKALETALKLVVKRVPAVRETVAVSPADLGRARVTGKSVRALRRKLRLSGAAFGKLLKVSGVTVYKWEKQDGPIRMRKVSKAAFLASRGLGAREAKKRLAQ